MPTFNYTVDTQPMADELNSVSRHVNGTTGAVIAMQSAVIAAENNASDLVCNNINRGFYSLIRSQISQKLAKLKSEVDSNLLQLVQQKKALLSIKNRMGKDYAMISARYLKLFNSLNVNLKNRVFELDKPTTDFACKEVDKISNRTKYLTATIPISQLESISFSQKIVSSNVKWRGRNVINSMRSFIHEMNMQKKLTDQILINGIDSNEKSISYIPILIYECNRDKSDHKNLDVVISDVLLNNNTKAAIKNRIFNESAQLNWKDSSKAMPEIRNEFNKYLNASNRSRRVVELAQKLYQSNKYQTI
ncbi:MAG: hypothetical protein M0P71_13485 [Melioribacteraceae bacterium]|nr:hypothetical protein [Melioribacteraceae bacterium]